jgi:predicted transcriptional regulator
MQDTRSVTFACPADVVDRVDTIARAEYLSRTDVLRRAIVWELRAAGFERNEDSSSR